MGTVPVAWSELVSKIVASIVMIGLAMVAFYFTVFVVATGAPGSPA